LAALTPPSLSGSRHPANAKPSSRPPTLVPFPRLARGRGEITIRPLSRSLRPSRLSRSELTAASRTPAPPAGPPTRPQKARRRPGPTTPETARDRSSLAPLSPLPPCQRTCRRFPDDIRTGFRRAGIATRLLRHRDWWRPGGAAIRTQGKRHNS
jgi:hypothetical protein